MMILLGALFAAVASARVVPTSFEFISVILIPILKDIGMLLLGH